MEDTTATAVGTVMGLVIAGVIGLIIGAVAKLLMPGPDPGGWFVTILLGIAGSWVGGFALSLLGVVGLGPALVGSVLGAMLLLLVYRMVKRTT
jgi:uncharacterized membrane protein YeaQ/YmgE (transglycosylase-associated protein family)